MTHIYFHPLGESIIELCLTYIYQCFSLLSMNSKIVIAIFRYKAKFIADVTAPVQISPKSSVKIRSGFKFTFGNWALKFLIKSQLVVAIFPSNRPVIAKTKVPIQIPPMRVWFR